MITQTVDKSATSPSRRDIDWLRVLATLTIFIFHCACPQNQKPTLSDNTRTRWGRRRPWLLAR